MLVDPTLKEAYINKCNKEKEAPAETRPAAYVTTLPPSKELQVEGVVQAVSKAVTSAEISYTTFTSASAKPIKVPDEVPLLDEPPV